MVRTNHTIPMPQDRFKPPATEVRDPPTLQGSAVKAVALGIVVDIVGTMLFSIALGVAYGIHLGLTGMNEQQIRSAASNVTPGSFLVGARQFVRQDGGRAAHFTVRNRCNPPRRAPTGERLPFLFIVGTIAGAGFSVLGGYVCERIARRQNYRVGLVLGCVSAGLAVLVGWSSTPPLQLVFFSLLTFVCVLVGTRFGHDNRRF